MPLVLVGLADLIPALMALVILFAFAVLFRPLLTGMASRIPLLGSAIANAIDGIISDSVAAGKAFASAAVSGVLGLVLAPVYWFEHIIAEIMNGIDSVWQLASWIATTLISQAVSIAVIEARVLIADAVASLENLINQVYQVIQVEISNVERALLADIAAAEAYSTELFQAAERFTEQEITSVVAYVGEVESALASDITAGLAAETAFVESEVAGAISYTEAVAASLGSAITADVTALQGWVTAELGSLTAYIEAVQAASAAYTAASVGVVEADLVKLETECTDNLCSGLSDLASFFNDLQGAFGIAGLIALAAEAARDPKGTAVLVNDTFGPLARAAGDQVRSAVGL